MARHPPLLGLHDLSSGLSDFSDTFFSKYLDRITNIRTHARDGLSMAKQGPDLEDKRSAARLAQAE